MSDPVVITVIICVSILILDIMRKIGGKNDRDD